MKVDVHFKPLFTLIFKYKKQHALAGVFMLINSLLSIMTPYILIRIIDDVIPDKDYTLLLQVVIAFLAIIVLQNGSKLISDYYYAVIGKKVVYDLRLKLVNHLNKMSGRYYSDANSGDLLTTINSDVATVEDFSTRMIFTLISDIITAVIMLIFLSIMQFDLLLVSVALQPLMFILQRRYNQKIHSIVTHLRNHHGRYVSVVEEYLSSMLTFTLQNAKKLFFRNYYQSARSFYEEGVKLQLHLSASMLSSNIISGFITISILSYGGYKVMIGAMTVGVLVAFNTYAQQLLNPIFRIAHFKMNIQQTIVAMEKIMTILDEPIDIQHDNGGIKPKVLKGDIEFHNVTFSYNDQGETLKEINLSFASNTVSALVGTSGSGKTTVTSLIYRLWDVDHGNILLDGIDIREYNLHYLRKNISIVSQDTFIFNDTILNNLRLAADLPMDEIIAAAQAADIYDFIMSLPARFDSKVGQNGVMLSGGQKQKISIARAILRDAPIIILDEATSSLDTLSEQTVQSAFQMLFTGKTVIIIAHRLSTIEQADIIYAIQDGQVVECGTHRQLMAQQSVYYRLYTSSAEVDTVKSM